VRIRDNINLTVVISIAILCLLLFVAAGGCVKSKKPVNTFPYEFEQMESDLRRMRANEMCGKYSLIGC